MIVRFYQRSLHYDLIKSWAVKRLLSSDILNDLPKIGFIAFDDDECAVACAFLRKCEGNVGILEGLMTNPECNSFDRHLAIDMSVKCLIKFSISRKYKVILAYSLDESTLARSSSHGFIRQEHTLIKLDLGE
jgi:hypothetical protein